MPTYGPRLLQQAQSPATGLPMSHIAENAIKIFGADHQLLSLNKPITEYVYLNNLCIYTCVILSPKNKLFIGIFFANICLELPKMERLNIKDL